jgi:uncharacterized protein (TIGR02001 family)
MATVTKIALGATSLLSMTTFAHAQSASNWAASAAVTVQSDYRFRGISQNDHDPAPQATFNISGPEGFYVGTWMSKIDWNLNGAANNPSLEVDIYGGKYIDVRGSDLSIEAFYYAYPDAHALSGVRASYFEAITRLSHSFGDLVVTGIWAYSPEYRLIGGDSNYLAASLSYPLNDWFSVSGNVGHQWIQAAHADYTHADLGVTATYRNLSLDLRYSTTDIGQAACSSIYMPTRNACAGGVAATLAYNIPSFSW